MQDQRYDSNYMFPRRMLFFHANRSAMVIRGLVFLVLGLTGLFRPLSSIAVVTVVLGIILLIDSAGALFLSLACRRFFGIVWSLLLCAAGVTMILRPLETDKLVMIVLGVWMIVTGADELLSAQVSTKRKVLSGSGILSILIGILLVIAPFVGLTAVSWLIAILLLISEAAFFPFRITCSMYSGLSFMLGYNTPSDAIFFSPSMTLNP